MAENTTEVIVGAAVLAAAIAFVVYAANATGFRSDPAQYPLTASFRSVEGISPGSDVRLAGVKVGSITSLVLNPKTYFADAGLMIDKTVDLPVDSAILISSEGLLGGSFVEIIPGGLPDNLGPGDEIEDTQGAVSLVSLLMKFVGGAASSNDAPAAPAPLTAPLTAP